MNQYNLSVLLVHESEYNQNIQPQNRNEENVAKKETPQRPLREPPSVRRRVSERRSRNADLLVASVVHAVEPLQPGLSADKVQTPARVAPEITNDGVDLARGAADGGVERPRPDLGVGRELKGGL